MTTVGHVPSTPFGTTPGVITRKRRVRPLSGCGGGRDCDDVRASHGDHGNHDVQHFESLDDMVTAIEQLPTVPGEKHQNGVEWNEQKKNDVKQRKS